MGIKWNGVNSGCKSKSDQQNVGKGTNNTAHENIRSFLTCGAHPESNHLCPSSKGHDGCSDNSLAQSNTLGETKSTLHQSRPPYRHCSQTTTGQEHRFPSEAARALRLL